MFNIDEIDSDHVIISAAETANMIRSDLIAAYYCGKSYTISLRLPATMIRRSVDILLHDTQTGPYTLETIFSGHIVAIRGNVGEVDISVSSCITSANERI